MNATSPYTPAYSRLEVFRGNMEQTVANSKRRKKRIETACPNQLFLQWLEEWRDEAKENGWSSHHSYHKALPHTSKH